MLVKSNRTILKKCMEDLNKRSQVLKRHEVLVLSTGYEPMFKTGWKRAISAVLSGRAEVIEKHDTLFIGTSAGPIECPTVVRFVTGVIAAKLRLENKNKRPTKKMLWHRDNGMCQYCSKKVTTSSATIDHVVPKSRGGPHTWDNLVIACTKCNSKKGNSLPKECNMMPMKKPEAPKDSFLPVIG